MTKHTDQETQTIIQSKIQDVQEQMTHLDQFNNYILETLNNFAYRYFEGAKAAECLTNNDMRVIAIENGIKEAIKIKNSQLRAGIAELVKRVSKDQGPTIARELRVEIRNRQPGRGGDCLVFARISFGHPEHLFLNGTFVEKMSELRFDDDIHFRNNLAKHLEVVCELFE